MEVKQFNIKNEEDWSALKGEHHEKFQLVLAFGNRHILEQNEIFSQLKAAFPNAEIVISSTAGQILGANYIADGLVVSAIKLEHSRIQTEYELAPNYPDSYSLGKALIEKLDSEDLKHVFLISDGQQINGSDLVGGMNAVIGEGIGITGGLAGDDARFEKTLVSLNNSDSKQLVIAIGFYGERLKVSYGSRGGWSAFGPERLVTKSSKNVLYELDGHSALDLYKKYLGPLSEELPGSALLFPLSITTGDRKTELVRTILSVDEDSQSMTFAGNLPEGSYARLMKSNSELLIDGAQIAAKECIDTSLVNQRPDLSIMVSCVGRRIVLDQLVEEEVEEALKVLGSKANTGFYSYGEICPVIDESKPELHNQTMTITLISEI